MRGLSLARSTVPCEQLVARAIQRRGSDDAGTRHHEGIRLGNSRLAAQDLHHHAAQSVHSGWQCCDLVVNGEICSFQTSQRDLQTKGAQLCTTGDPEAFVVLFARYGEAMQPRVEIRFVLVIWYRRCHCLFAACVLYAIKPLCLVRIADRRFLGKHLLARLRTMVLLGEVKHRRKTDFGLPIERSLRGAVGGVSAGGGSRSWPCHTDHEYMAVRV